MSYDDRTADDLRLGVAEWVGAGEPGTLLDRLHAPGCDGRMFSKCQVVGGPDDLGVVFMEWCGDCGAADYELV